MVDADLSKYFDTIPHDELLCSVAARAVDRHVLRLIKLWLKTPVEETDPDGRRHMSGGKQSTCGTHDRLLLRQLLRAACRRTPGSSAAAAGHDTPSGEEIRGHLRRLVRSQWPGLHLRSVRQPGARPPGRAERR